MTTEWRDVVGYEGFYEVSDSGLVRSLDRIVKGGRGTLRIKTRILKPAIDHHGYPRVVLSILNQRRGWFVHLLVLTAFVGPRPDGMQCCHYDGNPGNPRLDNLRWDTRTANMLDQIRHGTHPQAKKTHCKHGHQLPPHVIGSWRHCTECRNLTTQRRNARLRAETAARREQRRQGGSAA